MFEIDLKSRKSIYQQVIDNFKELIITGIITDDEKLPSVRDLAKVLTINPRTIQKAYQELERQNYVYMVSGKGTFATPGKDREIDEKQVRETESRLRELIRELKFLGYDKKKTRELMEKLLKEAEEK